MKQLRRAAYPLGGDTTASIQFTAPVDTGGSPIISYTVTSSPGGLTNTAATSPITVTGLTNGISYTFTVRATNSMGTGVASSVSNSTIPGPTSVTVINNPPLAAPDDNLFQRLARTHVTSGAGAK